MRYIIVLFLLLTGCGRFWPAPVIHQDFIPYVQEFEALWERKVNFTIIYGDVPNGYIGVCRKWSDGHREVYIDREWWEDTWTDESDKAVLIFHELGHCALGRGHLDDYDYIKSQYVSIMNSFNIGNWYEGNEDYYDFELFNPGQEFEGSHGGCVLKMD